MMNDELEQLRAEISALRTQMNEQAMREGRGRGRVMLGKGTTDVWCEQVVDADDTLIDMTQGRKAVAAGNYSLIEDPDAFVVFEEEVEGAVRYAKVGGESGRWFKIASGSQDGSNRRWTYTAKRATKTAVGHGGWSNDAVDTADYTLYASVSQANGTSGTYGEGIAAANLTGSGFDLVKLGANAVVWALPVHFTVSEVAYTEWWIANVVHQPDGTCP
jgi:hypothetical protein